MITIHDQLVWKSLSISLFDCLYSLVQYNLRATAIPNYALGFVCRLYIVILGFNIVPEIFQTTDM